MTPEWVAIHFPSGYPGNWVDSDADGLDNLSEYIAGTLPSDDTSVFKVVDAEPVPAGFVISWNAASGRQYSVYWSDDLANGFVPLSTNLLYPVNSYTDTVHSAEGGGFYFIDIRLKD